MQNLKSTIESIGDTAEDVRLRAAESLESAAESVRAAGDRSASAIRDLTKEAGKKLDSTATFVRPCAGGSKRILGRVRSSVRRNPVVSLALASAVVLLVGFSCRPSAR
jgi:ElaB/YqjD/DUF883 family membrane-anchored ribosome-binding protein